MAKRSSAGRGRKSRQVDWVVNDETYGSNVQLPNAGTQVLLALTIPKFVTSMVDPTLSVAYGNYMYPEQDSGQVAYAVRGSFSVVPSTWAANEISRYMVRIVKKPIEYATALQAVTDPNYTLFSAEFANERFLYQKFTREAFSLGGNFTWEQHISWKGVCKLDPDEALWLVIENQSGGTGNMTFNCFFRTLMRADA